MKRRLHTAPGRGREPSCIASGRSHSAPVVFYSADGNTADVEQARRLGAQDYIVKGVTSWSDICSIVARYV